MLGQWNSLVWLVVFLFPLLYLKRWINQHLQGLGLLLFGEESKVIILYFVLLFPGIALHELSHWVAARLLGVKTGGISLHPEPRGKHGIRLGSVKVSKTDPLRDSLIGLAPLITGTAVILVIASLGLGLSIPEGQPLIHHFGTIIGNLPGLLTVPDLWLLLYVVFVVSNAMLPSESDRQPWLSVGIYLALVIILVFMTGTAPQIPARVTALGFRAVANIALAFGLTIVVDFLFIALIFLLESVIGWLKGQRVIY